MSLYGLLKEYIPQSIQHATEPMQIWHPGVTPFSTLKSTMIMSALYLIIVLGGREFMRNRPPVSSKLLRTPFLVHNILLSLASGLLLALYLEEMLPYAKKYGWHDSICVYGATSSRMTLFYIINYYFKYWEFVDTFFLVAKKKPLMFLHVYHHVATAFLCWTQIVGRTPMAWAIICLNLFVHVIMYAYYAASSVGIRFPFKKLITLMQIVQFFVDLYICYYGTYNHYATYFFPWLPHRHCDGDHIYAWTGIVILSSYLVLFIFFYRSTYNKAKKGDAKKAN
ncbi:very-long-chain 3-oxoacyl-CoA synthase [Malassezia vespertilionis]|uniref:very-long-chain 3-oxoacyl-CoA synthase n=1 Tax=Malassezia vespertilionis TaxID=2020962 RepID=UPI0024B0D150|nr:very-long-chain 3-oxoacyl-CoA synthase [Malassezia vespertilionis]WFD08254.1 very-long-chain 3-oxoacyl-CoA synthase [Malassezia vespertilionis]